jgi:hypothetical protein
MVGYETETISIHGGYGIDLTTRSAAVPTPSEGYFSEGRPAAAV